MMGMNPVRFSVIIPAHNEVKPIASCLESVAAQTRKPYEILVVNNNSTDQTAKMASSFGVRVIDEKNKGAAAARNAGARIAKGEFLVFLDADCIAPTTHLELIANLIRQYPKIDGFAGPYVIQDGGKIVEWITETGLYYWHWFRFIKCIFGHQGFSGGNVAIKRSSFLAASGFDETIHDVIDPDDAEFAARLHRLGYRIFFDPKLIVYSSFRRMRKTPIRLLIVRTWQATQHILHAKTAT